MIPDAWRRRSGYGQGPFSDRKKPRLFLFYRHGHPQFYRQSHLMVRLRVKLRVKLTVKRRFRIAEAILKRSLRPGAPATLQATPLAQERAPERRQSWAIHPATGGAPRFGRGGRTPLLRALASGRGRRPQFTPRPSRLRTTFGPTTARVRGASQTLLGPLGLRSFARCFARLGARLAMG